MIYCRFDEWLIVSASILTAELGVGYFFERWVRRRFYERHVEQLGAEGKARLSET